jgi:hypothetical protein
MKRFVLLLILLSSILNSNIHSQGEGALWSSTIQQSILLIGAGQIGTAIPNNDVLGFYLNPAILGYSAIENHASISFMPDRTIWGRFNTSDLTYNNYGFNLGYNLATTSLKLPVSIGLGYISNKFDYGRIGVTSPSNPESSRSVESYDKFDSFSLGIGLNYFVQLNFGLSFKLFDSQIGARFTDGKLEKFSADGSMIDYGFLMRVPIFELINSDKKLYNIVEGINYSPIMNLSIGYSKNNIGDEIYYVDEAQKDPLSRTARLGYSIDLGFNIQIENVNFNFINYSFTAEAEDILIKPRGETDRGIEYQDGIGDIDISENLLQLKANENIRLHKGHIFSFLETFILTTGRISGKNLTSSQISNGIGFTTDGLFKLVSSISKNPTLKYVTTHFRIEYFDTDYEINQNNSYFGIITKNFDGLSIHFRGFKI